MKKFKLIKNRRVVALSLAATVFTSMISGCSKKIESDEIEQTELVAITQYDEEKKEVDFVIGNISALFPKLSDETISNTSLILLLDYLAKEDENGKISADVISNFKNIIDSDNMINEFNAFLGTLENAMISEKRVIPISSYISNKLDNDKKILSIVENITSNIIKSSNSEQVVSEFAKIYDLFVEEKKMKIDGIEFEIRDLGYGFRAVAQAYARTSAYYSKNYITDEQYKKIDDRTNDQNNKAQLKTKLEVLSNQIFEQSEIDVISALNSKYSSVDRFLKERLNISLEIETEKNLINYANLKYLASDKVSTKDKRELLGKYEDFNINEVMLAIDTLFAYNYKNQENAMLFSDLLINDYAKTENGLIDVMALNFVQYNAIMLLNSTNINSTFDEIFNNPYFQNIYKYIIWKDVTYEYYDENNNSVKFNIPWQEISDGVHFIDDTIILYTLNKLPNFDYKNSYLNQAESNLNSTIQYIQNTINNECKKVDTGDFVKVK